MLLRLTLENKFNTLLFVSGLAQSVAVRVVLNKVLGYGQGEELNTLQEVETSERPFDFDVIIYATGCDSFKGAFLSKI